VRPSSIGIVEKVKKAVLSILLAAVWIGGCTRDDEKELEAVQDTVLRYTQLLAEGYANMNMTNLQEAATKEQATKAYNHMSALGEAKIKMESHLEDIEFKDIQLSSNNKARVTTREEWNYTHIGTDPKMPSQRVVEGLIYDLAYELVKGDGKWLVSSISVLQEDRPAEPAKRDDIGLKGPDCEGESANAI
jgi:hypothetical protein